MRYVIRAQVHTIGSYAAHADQKGLVKFVAGMRKGPTEIRIDHSDPAVKQQLAGVRRKPCGDSITVVEIVIPYSFEMECDCES